MALSDFYQRSPCGERLATAVRGLVTPVFLSTLSLRRATWGCRQGCEYGPISIHALLAESDRPAHSPQRMHLISIHALLAESDFPNRVRDAQNLDFYPRSPCGERRANLKFISTNLKFLSTLSLRRATHLGAFAHQTGHFYPRSPCGERRVSFCTPGTTGGFLSTLSLRRATISAVDNRQLNKDFYPRSPCGERRANTPKPAAMSYLYPRSP